MEFDNGQDNQRQYRQKREEAFESFFQENQQSWSCWLVRQGQSVNCDIQDRWTIAAATEPMRNADLDIWIIVIVIAATLIF
jgi:hypothetical protein